LLRDIEASTGIELEVDIHWVTPEEQFERDAEWDRLFSAAETDPNVRVVLLGSAEFERPLLKKKTTGFWEVALFGERTMVHDVGDIFTTIQERVIEELWGQGRSASWPECPIHGGHPLDADLVDEPQTWFCPKDRSVIAQIGKLGT